MKWIFHNRPLHGYRPSSVEGRIQAPARSSHDLTIQLHSLDSLPIRMVGCLGIHMEYGHHSASRGNVDGSILQPIGVVESGPFLHVQCRTPFQGSSRQPRPASSFPPSVILWNLYSRHR